MKIGLFCAAGFSTGMLVNNMKVAAKELGIDAEIDAYSQAKLADFAPEIDVALLGPQELILWINQKRFVRQTIFLLLSSLWQIMGCWMVRKY